MAFETREETKSEARKDFNGTPICSCGRQTIVALATVVNKHTGAMKTGAASEFSNRDKEKRPNGVLQDHYSLIEFRGYCARCWDKYKEPGLRTYDDDLVRNSWQWFLGQTTRDSTAMGSLFSSGSVVTIEKQEEYLEVVNREAKRCNNPEAIPDEYKLAEVWG
jgi:hypothetical protein